MARLIWGLKEEKRVIVKSYIFHGKVQFSSCFLTTGPTSGLLLLLSITMKRMTKFAEFLTKTIIVLSLKKKERIEIGNCEAL